MMKNEPVSEFLRSAGDKPYRKLVEHHLRKHPVEQLTKALQGELALLPDDLVSYVEVFIDAVNARLGYDRQFWAEATCRQGFDAIMEVALHVFPLADLVDDPRDLVRPENQHWVFGLFQIATLNFAYFASNQRKQRAFIGIRKGLFR